MAYTPALNGLEQAAFILLCVQKVACKPNASQLAKDAWDDALTNFANLEAGYLGLEVTFIGAHERAKEMCSIASEAEKAGLI
jgi:hypothetical protein